MNTLSQTSHFSSRQVIAGRKNGKKWKNEFFFSILKNESFLHPDQSLDLALFFPLPTFGCLDFLFGLVIPKLSRSNMSISQTRRIPFTSSKKQKMVTVHFYSYLFVH